MLTGYMIYGIHQWLYHPLIGTELAYSEYILAQQPSFGLNISAPSILVQLYLNGHSQMNQKYLRRLTYIRYPSKIFQMAHFYFQNTLKLSQMVDLLGGGFHVPY